jgi:hypothetical protein
MRTADGKSYICHVPRIAKPTPEEERRREESVHDMDVLNKGLSLLEPMKGEKCLFYVCPTRAILASASNPHLRQ